MISSNYSEVNQYARFFINASNSNNDEAYFSMKQQTLSASYTRKIIKSCQTAVHMMTDIDEKEKHADVFKIDEKQSGAALKALQAMH